MALTATNTGPVPCTLYGAPDVTLVAANDKAGAASWQLVSGSAKTAAVTLAQGGHAVAELAYLPGDGGSTPFTPITVKITLPGTSSARTVPWPLSSTR